MNENPNLSSVLITALSQLQDMKEKIDPKAYESLRKSAHEAIESAHHFLDACEKVIDSLVPKDQEEVDLENIDDVIEFKKAK